jgi:hypothetical protein
MVRADLGHLPPDLTLTYKKPLWDHSYLQEKTLA